MLDMVSLKQKSETSRKRSPAASWEYRTTEPQRKAGWRHRFESHGPLGLIEVMGVNKIADGDCEEMGKSGQLRASLVQGTPKSGHSWPKIFISAPGQHF